MKIVSQLDANGYFVGPTVADASPRNPQVWLLPGGAIDVPPPEIPPGKVALWQGTQWAFVNPPDPSQEEDPPVDGVPQVVTRAQAKAALAQAGLLDAVQAIMDNPETPVLYRIAWNDAQEFRRTSPTLAALAVLISLSEQDLDNLFTVAAGIEL